METIKAQPTLRGFNAYVVGSLAHVRGVGLAETASWIIDQWINDNFEDLKDRYGISLDRYQESQITGSSS
jgi:hypothetical protein